MQIECTEDRLIVEEVMVYVLPHVAIKIFKHDEYHWIVGSFDLIDPVKSKAVLCISFEQASWVFDGCLQNVRETVN